MCSACVFLNIIDFGFHLISKNTLIDIVNFSIKECQSLFEGVLINKHNNSDTNLIK